MKRRTFLHGVGASLAAWKLGAGLATAAPAKPAMRKPNLLLILVDDLGKEWINCYGAEGIKTPHIDALAKGGIRFNNAYSMPQCTPSRATLLTGQYPWRHGWINHWDVPRWGLGCHFDWNKNPSIGRVMKSAGYATAAAGKWQINDFRVQSDAMKQHGFDDWCMWTGYESGVKASSERYWNPYINTPKGGSCTIKGKFGPDVFFDFITNFTQANKGKPWMVYYPMVLTHTPFVHTPDEPDVKDKMGRHKAMVRYTDKLVGKLIATLKKQGQLDNTIIVFTTDNGTCGAITGRRDGRSVKGGKATDWERGINAPFIVYGPGCGVPVGMTSDCLLDFTDLLPTFAALGKAKLPAKYTIDGQSMADVFLGKAKDGPRNWIMAMGHGPAAFRNGRVMPKNAWTLRVVRDKQYKAWATGQKVTQLYDLNSDPTEKNNLVEKNTPEIQAAIKKFQAIIEQFPSNDPGPKYDKLPPQPWDNTPKARKKKPKKKRK